MWGVLLSAIILSADRESMARAGLSKIVIGPRIGGIRLHTLEELLKPLSSPPSVHKGLSKQTVGLAGMRLQADGSTAALPLTVVVSWRQALRHSAKITSKEREVWHHKQQRPQ
jgi:hypothetical protein